MATRFEHPAWLTAAGTALSYVVVLLVLFLVVFVVPYLAFTAIGG